MQTFPEHWRRRTPVSVALWPLSMLYGAVVRSRRWLYRSGLLDQARVGVPVIVLGNLFVGGTGKTPLTLALARSLRQSGYSPGILCSGYGGRNSSTAEVSPHSDPLETGDEPVLLAMSSGCPVWRGKDRVAAARGLMKAHPSCSVLLCDDGLQHYPLGRDLEIEVLDERGHGNGLLLPAGPLREPASRAVDARVFNGTRSSEDHAPTRDGTPVFSMALQPARLYRLDKPKESLDWRELQGKELHAVAGTGNPQRFFDTLAGLGLRAVHHAFPDHHPFRAEDLAFPDCEAVVMTEKDAVKCSRFKRTGLYALQVEARLEPAFFDFVTSRLAARRPGAAGPASDQG